MVFASCAFHFRKIIEKKICIIFILTGFIWAFPLRHFVAMHDFQSLYYIGIPIMFYITIHYCLRCVNIKPFSLIILVLFCFNIYYLNIQNRAVASLVNPVTLEFQKIYDTLPSHSTIYVDGDKTKLGIGFHAVNFYLAGHYFSSIQKAEYIISQNKIIEKMKLTDNQIINLFKN